MGDVDCFRFSPAVDRYLRVHGIHQFFWMVRRHGGCAHTRKP